MVKKILVSLALLVLAGLMVASTNLYGANAAVRPSSAPTIALVNEDQSASFNGTDYLFGKDFVSLVSNDSEYNWQVVSRSVAERAYSDKAVSAVIFLPRTFSHDILTLQDLNPTKAVIDYKVVNDDELAHRRLENQVSTVLRDFNTRVVKMYFASVAGNISGAQVNMSAVVASQSALVDSLSTSIYPELETTAKGYGTSVSLASILQAMNSSWISAQNGFTSNTTKTLTSISESLNKQQPGLSAFFALQEQIARTNVANGNSAIGEQSTSDKSYYDEAFAAHIEALYSGDGKWSGFDGFSSTDADGRKTGVLAALQETVAGYDRTAAEYNAQVAGVSAALSTQKDELTTSLRQLQELEKNLLSEYFTVSAPEINDGNFDIDPSTLREDLARAALAQKVSDSFSADGSAAAAVSKYDQRLKTLAGTIPTDPAQYAPLFSTLQANTGFDPAPYLSQLAVIKKYADSRGIVSPTLNVLQSATTSATTQTVSTSLPVSVPAGARYTVTAALPSSIQQSDVHVGTATPAGCDTVAPECVSLDQTTGVATIDNTRGADPIVVDLTYAIDLKDFAGTAAVTYTAQDTATPSAAPQAIGGDVYVLAPSNAAREQIGGDDFVAITAYLGNIQSTASLLHFLFGDPDDTFDDFANAVQTTVTFDDRSAESVFNRYGTIDTSRIADRLSASDVRNYQKLGQDNIAAIVTQIKGVQGYIRVLDDNVVTLSRLKLTEGYFSNAMQQLESWYTAAMTSVEASADEWDEKSNTVIQLSTVPWNGQDAGKSELYLDEKTGPALYATVSGLVAVSSENAKGVAASAQIITDNTDRFDELTANVGSTQTDTQAVLDAMKGTIATGSTDVANSSDYSTRFATVLSNTRANGVDPETIYETFANPVSANDTTPAAAAETSAGFDWRWAVLFAAGSLVGILLGRFSRRRTGRNQDVVR